MKEGDKVTYLTPHGGKEWGVVKRMDGDHAFVVYHWVDDEKNYVDYTAARTRLQDLREGWIE